MSLVLDLAGLDFCDSAGLAVLVGAHNRLDAAGRRLVVAAPTQAVARVLDLSGYRETISPARETLLKLNLSWTQYFPACSTEPWQLEGVVRKLLEDGFERERLLPVENKTVVTNPRKGCTNNLWEPILDRYGLTFTPLPERRGGAPPRG